MVSWRWATLGMERRYDGEGLLSGLILCSASAACCVLVPAAGRKKAAFPLVKAAAACGSSSLCAWRGTLRALLFCSWAAPAALRRWHCSCFAALCSATCSRRMPLASRLSSVAAACKTELHGVGEDTVEKLLATLRITCCAAPCLLFACLPSGAFTLSTSAAFNTELNDGNGMPGAGRARGVSLLRLPAWQ